MLLYYNYDKNLKSIKKSWVLFFMWNDTFSIANVPKVKKWPPMKFEFSRVDDCTHACMASARKFKMMHIKKKPRFGTFQSIMIIFYVKLLENIYPWRKKPHRPSKTHFLPKFHLIEEEEKSKFCEIVDDNRMNVDCLTKRHPWKKFSLMFR